MPLKPTKQGDALEARISTVEAMGPRLEGLESTMSEFRAALVEIQQSHLDMQKSMMEKIQQVQENLQQSLLKEIYKIGGKRVEGDQGRAIPVDGSSSS